MAETKNTIPEFAVEATHPRMCDLLIQGLTGVCDRRLRSKIIPVKTTIQGTPSAKHSRGISPPEVPGQVLQVHPSKCAVRIIDPLRDDEHARDYQNRLENYLKQTHGGNGKVNGVPVREGKLDQDRMKTLCRELLGLIKEGHMTLVKGVSFSLKDCDALPGDYLLNPGSLVPNQQPKYEKDLEEYARRLNSMS